ncbi:MAG: 3'(2') 5'-bisphosphate nucleotidase [Rhodospirillaceae bacterium]|nr:MAG: 3'(2') 5'-bisphosphate nucleotidase [Rhodospirillaceae bacterium]
MDVLVSVLCTLARRAGGVVLDVYRSDFTVTTKADDSPVTRADQAAEDVIVQGLRDLACDIPIVAEEAMAAGQTPDISGNRFWLVDPLDGTEAFIRRNGEFTVNIALIENGRPVVGVIYAPVRDQLYMGAGPGTAQVQQKGCGRLLSVRMPPPEGVTVLASHRHGDVALLDAFLKTHSVHSVVRLSSSLKLCLVAAGEADLYPRFGRTMEWDTAAGHAILEAAGGCVCTLGGEDLRYGKPGFDNPHFIARGTATPI